MLLITTGGGGGGGGGEITGTSVELLSYHRNTLRFMLS